MPSTNPKINSEKFTTILEISIPQAEYMPRVDKKLKEYKNKVQIKGFRTGEAPMSFLKSKFGNSILTEEIQELVNTEIQNYITNEKLNVLGSPMPVTTYDVNISKPADVEVAVEIGYIPEFELKGLNQSISLPFYQIEVDAETLQKEILSQRNKLSTDFVENPDMIESLDTLKVSITEYKDGAVVLDGQYKDETYLAVAKMPKETQALFLGKCQSDEIVTQIDVLDTALDLNQAKKMLYGLQPNDSCSLQAIVKVLEIKRPRLRELDQDFYKQVFPNDVVETFEAFEEKMKQAISEGFNGPIYNILNRNIYLGLMNANENMPIPVDFLKKFVQETQLKGEKIEDQQFELLLKQVKWSTITQILTDKYQISVSKEDVEYQMRMAIARYYGFQISPFHNLFDDQVKKMMGDQENYRKFHDEVLEAKLFSHLENEIQKINQTVDIEKFKLIYDETFKDQEN